MTIRRLHPFKIKSVGESGTFAGYASIFGNIDSYRDIVMPGAFTNTLQQNSRIKMLWQHRADMPIGGYTLAKEDETGLYVEGQINLDVEKGREAYALLKSGDVDGLSIGYRTVREEFNNNTLVNSLIEVDLREISVVTFPANDLSVVASVKSADEISTLSDVEDFMRGRGLSHKEAKAVIALVKKTIGSAPRDAGKHGDDLLNRLKNISL